ncbi:MAG: hypothetical protein H6970_01985 [Gammaproteobacteria bacterium]|nr:hypothetical protein [Gammaproteobacteria bacterium]MCP5423830.1 hypothetical protein [Gammaproteobacteria bacterium]
MRRIVGILGGCLVLLCLGSAVLNAQTDYREYRANRNQYPLERQQREQSYDLKTRQRQIRSRSDQAGQGSQQPAWRYQQEQLRSQMYRQERQRQRSLPSRPEPIQRQDFQGFEREYKRQDLGFKMQDRPVQQPPTFGLPIFTDFLSADGDRFNH